MSEDSLSCSTSRKRKRWHANTEANLYLDPKVCKIMAFMATIMGLGLLLYILLGLGTPRTKPMLQAIWLVDVIGGSLEGSAKVMGSRIRSYKSTSTTLD